MNPAFTEFLFCFCVIFVCTQCITPLSSQNSMFFKCTCEQFWLLISQTQSSPLNKNRLTLGLHSASCWVHCFYVLCFVEEKKELTTVWPVVTAFCKKYIRVSSLHAKVVCGRLINPDTASCFQFERTHNHCLPQQLQISDWFCFFKILFFA